MVVFAIATVVTPCQFDILYIVPERREKYIATRPIEHVVVAGISKCIIAAVKPKRVISALISKHIVLAMITERVAVTAITKRVVAASIVECVRRTIIAERVVVTAGIECVVVTVISERVAKATHAKYVAIARHTKFIFAARPIECVVGAIVYEYILGTKIRECVVIAGISKCIITTLESERVAVAVISERVATTSITKHIVVKHLSKAIAIRTASEDIRPTVCAKAIPRIKRVVVRVLKNRPVNSLRDNGITHRCRQHILAGGEAVLEAYYHVVSVQRMVMMTAGVKIIKGVIPICCESVQICLIRGGVTDACQNSRPDSKIVDAIGRSVASRI